MLTFGQSSKRFVFGIFFFDWIHLFYSALRGIRRGIYAEQTSCSLLDQLCACFSLP